MSDDFENKLAALFREQVDHELGERRPAPPMRRPAEVSHRTSRRRSSPWMMPLLAAACVAALVGGGIGVSQLVSDGSNPATNHQPSTVDATHSTLPSPTSTPTTTPVSQVDSTPSTHAAPPPASMTTSQSAPPPKFTTADFRGAKIAVPDGWKLIDNNETTGQDGQSKIYFWGQTACLQPVDGPQDSQCRIFLQLIHPPTGTPDDTEYAGMDVDALGPVGPGNPGEYSCDEKNYSPSTVQETAADSTFGGRSADLRIWKRSCNGKVRFVEAHYVVASPTAYDMYLDDYKDPATYDRDLAALQTIAQYSQLPAASGGVRYMDRGIIRSKVVGQTTVTIAIDRVIATRQGGKDVFINHNPETYSYTVPLALWNSAKVKVGERVVLTTDGSAAITLAKDLW